MQRLNIIKYIEENTGKDIWDFQEIVIIMDGEKYSHKPLYYLSKRGPYMYDSVHKTGIADKSQIFNRLQYIKQSGYVFKNYMTTIGMEKLIIAFE